MQNLKPGTAVLIAAGIALATAPSALAGTATYSGTGPGFVPDGATRSAAITVPAGRTSVQSIEVTNIGISWFASGQDMSAQLIGPDASSMFLWEVGCFKYGPAGSTFTLTDSADTPMPEFNGCNDVNLAGASFRPVDPQNRKLSSFAGRTATGAWTLQAIDGGVGPANQGSILTWALRIVHAPPTLTATAPASAKLKKTLDLTATSNATGSVVIGGDAKSGSTDLTANQATRVPYSVTKKVRKKVEKKGKARVTISLDFTDATGGTATQPVTIKLKDKSKKKD